MHLLYSCTKYVLFELFFLVLRFMNSQSEINGLKWTTIWYGTDRNSHLQSNRSIFYCFCD